MKEFKIVFMVAGRGKRMGSLTDDIPKPMLQYAGKNLIEHKLETLRDMPEGYKISEIVMIIGYLGNVIKNYFGNEWNGISIRYVEELELKGTGYAISKAKEAIGNDDFVVFPGDDLFTKEDVHKVVKSERSMLVSVKKSGKVSGGKVSNDGDLLVSITEGTHEASEDNPVMISTSMYKLNRNFFKYPLVKIDGREEYGLPQTLVLYAKDYPVEIIIENGWKQVTSPEDLI